MKQYMVWSFAPQTHVWSWLLWQSHCPPDSVQWCYSHQCIVRCFCMTQILILYVLFDFISRNMLWPILFLFLNQNLSSNFNMMKSQGPRNHTNMTLYCDNFTSVVDWFGHLQHQCWCLHVILKLCWITWIVVLIHWLIFYPLKFDVPHNWLPLVPIINGMMPVSTWM